MSADPNVELYSIAHARFLFTMEACEDATLGKLVSSTLRGAMGAAMRQMVRCEYRNISCRKCMDEKRWDCICRYIMEPSRLKIDNKGELKEETLTTPYIIEPPLKRYYPKGTSLNFHLILIGNYTVEYLLPVFIKAFKIAGEKGLGFGDYSRKFRLLKVEQEKNGHKMLLWDGGDLLIRPPIPIHLRIDATNDPIDSITMVFHTKMRLQAHSEIVEENPEFSVLWGAVSRRLHVLGEVYGQGGLTIDRLKYNDMALSIKKSDVHQNRWNDFKKYSGRQKQEVPMGGILGRITYEGDLRPFVPYLEIAEQLHVGKDTSFGHGKFRLLIGKNTD